MQCKRARLVGERRFTVESVEFPQVNGTPIIQVSHVEICVSDVHFWEDGAVSGKDLVLGHEYTGIIVEPGNSGLKKGQRVVGYTQNPGGDYCGWCEECRKGNIAACTNRIMRVSLGCSTKHPDTCSEYVTWFPSGMFPLPDHVGSDEAALTEPPAVGFHAMGLSGVRPGDKVLILGGGIIGLGVAEWANVCDTGKIVMTELSAPKRKRIRGYQLVDELYASGAPVLEEKLRTEVLNGYDLVGEVLYPGMPIKLSDTPCAFQVGGDNEDILTGISGYTVEELEQLKAEKAI